MGVQSDKFFALKYWTQAYSLKFNNFVGKIGRYDILNIIA